MSLMSFDPEKCTACGICSAICPMSIIMVGEDGIPSLPTEYEGFCSCCGHCEAACPKDAITGNYPSFAPENDVSSTTQVSPEILAKYVQSRRSTRVFKDKPVEKEKIAKALEAVRFAPSGMNIQPVKWLVITDAAEIKKLAGLTIDWMRMMAEKGTEHPLKSIFPALVAAWDTGKDPICRGAPCLVYAYTENASGYTDSIIALATFDLMAPAFDLGTCWTGLLQIAVMEYQPLQEALDLPRGYIPQYPMTVGYPKYRFKKIPGRKKADVVWR